MATFPSIGILLADGFEEVLEPAVIRTAMESGPYKQARVSGKNVNIRSIKYWFTNTEYPTFLTWFRNDIARGADKFYWTDPVDSTIKLARIVNGSYKVIPEAPLNRYTVEFELETYE